MVPVSVELQGAAPPLRKVTPCILPPLNAVVSVQVESPRYWARELAVSSSAEHAATLRRRVLWVKRKTGVLHSPPSRAALPGFCLPYLAV